MPSCLLGSKDKCSLVSVPTGTVSSHLPLVPHVLPAVQVIREGVAPAVYWTFSLELQVLGWESPGSLSLPSLCITSEYTRTKEGLRKKELRVLPCAASAQSRPISPCVPALNQITPTPGAGP